MRQRVCFKGCVRGWVGERVLKLCMDRESEACGSEYRRYKRIIHAIYATKSGDTFNKSSKKGHLQLCSVLGIISNMTFQHSDAL